MTRLELRNMVIANVRRTDKDDVINAAIKMALDEITRTHAFRELTAEIDIPVITGDSEFNLPDDFSQLRNVRLLDAVNTTLTGEITVLPFRQFQRLYPTLNTVVTGKPGVGYEFNGSFKFRPSAGTDYTFIVTYDRKHPEMTDTDSTVTSLLDNAVIAWATHYVFKSIQMYEDSQVWAASFEDAMIKAIRADKEHPGQLIQSERVLTQNRPNDYNPFVNTYTPD